MVLLAASFLTLAIPASAQRNEVPASHPRLTNSNGSSENWSGYAVTGPTGLGHGRAGLLDCSQRHLLLEERLRRLLGGD